MNATSNRIQRSQDLAEEDNLPEIQYYLKILLEADLWWRPNDRSNNFGILLLHLAASNPKVNPRYIGFRYNTVGVRRAITAGLAYAVAGC